MHSGFSRYMLRRSALAMLLVLVVSSAALLLARLAPGDHLGFDIDPVIAAAERHRLGRDRPFLVQYGAWLARVVRLDLGESLRYGRPVADLIGERAGNTALLGISALIVATALGIPAGILTGSRRRGLVTAAARGVSILFLSIPPLITSLALLLVASRTGWFPVGGFVAPPTGAGIIDASVVTLRHLVLPVLALALPVAAALERLQSRSIGEALSEPCILAARARGLPMRRVVWHHALRLSLKPVLAIYGIIIGSLLSGSFAVEIVMTWPGLGRLMYDALTARDTDLVAGCAAAGSAFLAAGILMSDLALAVVDPRVEEAA